MGGHIDPRPDPVTRAIATLFRVWHAARFSGGVSLHTISEVTCPPTLVGPWPRRSLVLRSFSLPCSSPPLPPPPRSPARSSSMAGRSAARSRSASRSSRRARSSSTSRCAAAASRWRATRPRWSSSSGPRPARKVGRVGTSVTDIGRSRCSIRRAGTSTWSTRTAGYRRGGYFIPVTVWERGGRFYLPADTGPEGYGYSTYDRNSSHGSDYQYDHPNGDGRDWDD